MTKLTFIKYILAAGAVSYSLLPHTVLLNTYRKYRARYGFDDKEIPVKKEMRQKFEEVLDDINVPEEQRKNIHLFSVYDVDVFHAGSTFLKNGAIIGIPPNFEYKGVDSITENTISFQTVEINWNTPAAKQFRETLVLSEDAQKFALALKALTVLEPYPILQTGCTVIDVALVLIAYNIICNRYQITKKQKFLRAFYMVMTGITGLIFWLITQTELNRDTETKINEKMSKLDANYIKGGIEYYEKLTNRNKALRELLGGKGKYLFTSSGNETAWTRQRTISITDQLDFFKSRLPSPEVV